MENTEERISGLKDRTIEITQSEQQRENRLEKQINRASGICGTLTKALTFFSQGSWKERRKVVRLKSIQRNNCGKFLKLVNNNNKSLQIQEVKQT